MATSDSKGKVPGGDVKFECGICLKEFFSTWCLQLHVKTHDEKRSFDCHECGVTFPAFTELCDHLKQHIFGEDSVKNLKVSSLQVCSVCGKEYPASQIAMHQRSHIFKPGLTCTTCGKSFGSRQVLKLHLRTHGSETLYQCKICGLKFVSRNSFMLHWNSHGTNKLSPFKLLTKTKRDESRGNACNLFSKYTKTGSRYKCTICSKQFSTSAKMEVHSLIHQSPTKKKTQRKLDVGSEVMNDHQAIKDTLIRQGNMYSCSICKKNIKGKSRAVRHAKYHFYQERPKNQLESVTDHMEVEKSSVKKPKIDNAVKRRESNNKEQPNHEEIDPELCPETLHTGSEINTETFSSRPHSVETLDCSECSKTFKTNNALQQHKKFHLQQYALGLIRILGHEYDKKKKDLPVEPETLLDAVQSAAELANREQKTPQQTDNEATSHPDEAHPVVASEGCDRDAKHLLKDFSDLYKMMNVKVVLERLDVSKVGRTCKTDNAHSTNVSISPENRIAFPPEVENNVPQSESNINLVDMALVPTCTNLDEASVNNSDAGDEHAFANLGSDFHDEELVPRQSAGTVSMNNVPESKNISELIKAEGDVSDDADDQANASAAAIVACDVDQDDRLEDLSTSIHDADKATYNKRIKLEIKDYITEFGPKKSASQDALKFPVEKDGLFRCLICKESMQTPDSAKAHMTKHAFKCSVCPFESYSEHHFEQHSEKHEKIRYPDMLSGSIDTTESCCKTIAANTKSVSGLIMVIVPSNSENESMDRVTENSSKDHTTAAANDMERTEETLELGEETSKAIKYRQSNELGGVELDVSRATSDVEDSPSPHESTSPLKPVVSSSKHKKRIRDYISKSGSYFHCEICRKKYKSKSKLYVHVKYHVKERKHKCEHCGKAFKDRQAILGHVMYHVRQNEKITDFSDEEFKAVKNNFVECGDTFTCLICNYNHKSRLGAYNHVLNHLIFDKSRASGSDTHHTETLDKVDHSSKDEIATTHNETDVLKIWSSSPCIEANKDNNLVKDISQIQIDIETDSKRQEGPETSDDSAMLKSFKDVQVTESNTDPAMRQENTNVRPVQTFYRLDVNSTTSYHADRSFGVDIADDSKSYQGNLSVSAVFNNTQRTGFRELDVDNNATETERDSDDTCYPQSNDGEAREVDEEFQAMSVTKHIHSQSRNHVAKGQTNETSKQTDVLAAPIMSANIGETSEEQKNNKSDYRHDQEIVSDMDKKQEMAVQKHECVQCCRHFSKSSQFEFHKLMHQAVEAIGENLQDVPTKSRLSQVLTCPVCKKEYPTVFKLREHVRVHTDERNFKCDVCGLAVKNQSQLLRHQKSHKPFKCDLCPRKFPEENVLQQHVQEHHREERREITVVTCDDSSGPAVKVASKTGSESDSINAVFTEEENSQEYTRVKQKDKNMSKVEQAAQGRSCNKDESETPCDSSSKPQYSDYVNKIDEMYGCTICQKKFELKVKCDAHVQNHFFKRKKHACKVCDYSTISKFRLRMHMNEHQKKQAQFRCSICQCVFPVFSYLTSHLDSHTDEEKIKHLNYLKCPTCGIACKNTRVFYRHKLEHLDTFQCKCCDVVLPSAVAFENHAYEMGHFYCEGCGRKYSSFTTLQSHQKGCQDEMKPFQCDQCPQRFASSRSLKVHLQSHEVKYTCKICKESFESHKELKDHKLEKKHEVTLGHYTCDICSKHFSKANVFELHKLIHQALAAIGEDIEDVSTKSKLSQVITCPVCRKEYPTFDKFREHARLHTEEKKFKCDICGLAIRTLSYLKTHQNIHNNERPFCCDSCPRSFHSQTKLNEHVKRSHEKDMCRMVTCDVCGKKLKKDSLKQHKFLHDQKEHVKRFPCEFCGKKFYTQQQLKCHKMTHSNQSVFMCDICGKFLNSKYTLQEHKKGHTGVKPFHCSECGKGFKNKQFLKRHLTVHSGEKPHVCDICNKAFNQPETLKNHRNIHTGEKPYKCDLCGERFGDRWARHRHMKRHSDGTQCEF